MPEINAMPAKMRSTIIVTKTDEDNNNNKNTSMIIVPLFSGMKYLL